MSKMPKKSEYFYRLQMVTLGIILGIMFTPFLDRLIMFGIAAVVFAIATLGYLGCE